MKYLVGLTENQVKVFSQQMYRLSRPESLADNDDTHYALYFFKHPQRNQWALMIPENYKIEMHPKVQVQLQQDDSPLIDVYAGIATELEIQQLKNTIIYSDNVSPLQLLPQSLNQLLINEEEIASDGWFDGE